MNWKITKKTKITIITLIFLISQVSQTMKINTQIKSGRLQKMKTFYKDLPVLVTGGAGFIGSHIVEKLVTLGAKVTIIDDLSSGNIQNLKNLKGKIKFICKSIVNMDACLKATKNQAVIFHLAAFISVPESMENPTLCHQVNVDGTFNILQAARINGVKKLVFSSSAAIYGPTELVCKENMTPNPQSPYGTTKLMGEYYCKQFANNFGLKTITLRYFNVFGQRQNPNGAYGAVVAKFTDLMGKNKPVTIFGDGLQTRDFIPVQDVVEANLTVAMLESKFMNGQAFNIGTGKSISLLELVALLKKDFPKYNKEMQFKPARTGDIKHSSADCSKYQSLEI
ncbi:NAD-dependent epimerase/dehydratase family protein [Candidatus Dependentiae bacterium]